MEIKPIEIELYNGSNVEFGKLGRTKDFFEFEAKTPNLVSTLMNAFLAANMITKFDSLTTILTEELLNLQIDNFDKIVEAAGKFYNQNGVPSFIDENTIKLIYGLKINDEIYDVIELGERAKPIHRAEAESGGLVFGELLAYLAMREIIGIKRSQDNIAFDGQLSILDIGELNLVDGIYFVALAKERRGNLSNIENKVEIDDRVTEIKAIQ